MSATVNSIAFSIFSNKGTYALLLGSGISRNSGIPTGWDITLDLIRKIAKLENEESLITEDWYRKKYGEEPDYSVMLEKLGTTPTERLNILKPYFEKIGDPDDNLLFEPSAAHRAIAKLIRKGYIKVVITTNFDRLLEKAIRDENIEPSVVRHPMDIDGVMPLVHSNFTLIKVNGDYLDPRFLNTKTELETYHDSLHNYILGIINDYGMISCGWSGKWDNGLTGIIRQSSNFRFNSFWTSVGEPNAELKEIALHRRGQNFQINQADSFFTEIVEKIEALERLNDSDPLSTDIAIARIKKYVAKDELKIQLYDLLIAETKKIEKSIQKNYNPTLYPSENNLKPIIENFSIDLESFIPLIVNAVNWSTVEHNPFFVEILSRLGQPIEFSHAHETSKDMNYFPALVVLYAIGITALKNKNYALIRLCLELKIPHNIPEYNNKIYLIEKANSSLIDVDLGRKIMGNMKYAPFSAYLEDYLKPYFKDLIFNDTQYKDTVDLWEYLISLHYVILVGEIFGHTWAPYGQYPWRRRSISIRNDYAITEFLKAAELEKDQWGVIKSGMFNGSIDTFNTTREKLENFLREVR